VRVRAYGRNIGLWPFKQQQQDTLESAKTQSAITNIDLAAL